MYTNITEKEREINNEDINDHSQIVHQIVPPSFHLIFDTNDVPTTHQYLRQQANSMRKAIFFYHESNPHSGILQNTRQLLYDHFQLVGPVQQSWIKILTKDTTLAATLLHYLSKYNPSHEFSIWTIAALFESLQSKRDISCCKFKSDVDNNQILFQKHKMTTEELVLLEALASYAGYQYELIE